MSRDNFIDIFQDSSEISEEEKKNNQLNQERMFSRMKSFIVDPDESDYQIDPNIMRKGRIKSEKEYWEQFELLSKDKKAEFLRDTLYQYDIFISQIYNLYVKRKRKWEATYDNVDLKFKEACPEELRMIVEGLKIINSERSNFHERLVALDPKLLPSKIIWREESNREKLELLIREWIGGKNHDIILNGKSIDDFIKRHFTLEGQTSYSTKGDYILWSAESVAELAWWIYCLHQAELIFVERNDNKNRKDNKTLTEAKYPDFICTHFKRFTNKGILDFNPQTLRNAYSSFRDYFDEDGVLIEEVLQKEKKSYLDIWNFVKNHLE